MSVLLSYGINIEKKYVRLSGEVDVKMYDKLCYAFDLVKPGPLMVEINTEGGDFYQALAIYDRLTERGQCITVSSGPVMSSGVIIMQGGIARLAYQNSQFMMHYGEESSTNSQQEAKHNHKMTKVMKQILMDRVKVKPRTVDNWFSKDTYFTAAEAFKVGLIDEVMTYEK